MGSDGLFDNVFEEDMLTCIYPHISDDQFNLKELSAVAQCLAEKAEQHGNDATYESPFSKSAKEHGINFHGGKADDITVIVAQFKLNGIHQKPE